MGKTKNEFSEVISCGHCGNKANMEIVATGRKLDVEVEQGRPVFDYGFYVRVLLCASCEGLTLLRAEEGPWADPEDTDPWTVVYPTSKLSADALPEHIQKAYEAASRVRGVDANFFAVGMRRVLEHICREKQAKGKFLADQLNDLANRELIPQTLAEMAHQLRALGNVGAHVGDVELSQEEVPILDGLCRAILEYVYNAPALVAKVRERIDQLKSPPATLPD